MVQKRRGGDLPQITQMRRRRRHGYPRIGEDIGGFPCPPKTVSVLSVVKNRCGGGIATDVTDAAQTPTQIDADGGSISVFQCPQ